MEIHFTNWKFLSLGLPLLLFSCAGLQQISDDEVYRMKTPDVPMDANLLDETAYETYKFRKDKKIETRTFYNEMERENRLGMLGRPLFPGSYYYYIGNTLYLCSNAFRPGYMYGFGATINDPFNRRFPRGKTIGFSASKDFTKPTIVHHPNNHNVYGTNPVYIKPNKPHSRPSFQPEGRSAGKKPRSTGSSQVNNTHRSTPSSVGRTTPTSQPAAGSGGLAPRSTSPTPKTGGRKF